MKLKHSLLSVLFFANILFGFAQLEVHIIDLTTNDLVYDAATNKIYASIPSSNGSNGNSIGIINVDTYILENTVFMGSEPTVLAISDNGQFIYSGFDGSSTVRRFNVTNQTADIQFALGSDSSSGSFYVEDLEVMPNNPNTIAISRKNIGTTPRHEGVAIYDDNVMRPITTQDHTGSNKIEFTNSNTLVGYNNETTEFGIRTLTTNASGITEGTVNNNILSGFGIDFVYHNNKVYATNGQVVDITSTPFVSGQFANTFGSVVYDQFLNKVCFANTSGGSAPIKFKRFNSNNFLLEDEITVNEATGISKSIISCGNGCYAFNSDNNKVVIIKDTGLSVDELEAENSITIYPNPVTNHFTVSSKYAIDKIEILDINGRIVKLVTNNIDDRINLNELSSGMYIIKVSFSQGLIKTEKIIKS